MPQRNLLIISISAAVSLACYHKSQHTRYAAVLADAMGQIVDRYVEPVDRRDLFEGALEGMVGRLDQYSGYIPPDELRALQENILKQQFGGVGIEVMVDHETERLTVLSPLVGTPADQAGLKAGDVILQIDGQPTEGKSVQDAVDLMRGLPGTKVRLSVLHLGAREPEQIDVTRAVINVESVVGDVRGDDNRWRFYLEDHPHIGYIRLITFGDRTAAELADALTSLPDSIQGLILDVRGNAGGLLEAAAAVSDMFVDDGQIVSTRDRRGRIEKLFKARRQSTLCRLPLAVLVDRYTASASEIVAACLQDHRRGKIIGERTWGKGTVQNVIFLEGNRSAIKLTTSTYWRPSHKNIHRTSTATEEDDWGVRPDPGYTVSLTDDEYVKLLKARRERYLSRAKHQNGNGRAAGDSDPLEETSHETDAAAPYEDPFISKGVQFLQQELRAAA